MNVDALDFLRTGRLGTLAVGMSRDEVTGRLGAPDGVAGGRKTPEILRYGSVQVMCEKLTVRAIFLGLGTNLSVHPEVSLVGWAPSALMTLADITAFLEANQLAFAVEKAASAAFTTLRIRTSGVRLAFTDALLDRFYVQCE